MIFETKFIHSKVGRRIFKLFLICALIPCVGLALLSYHYVSKQLYSQGYDRLTKEAKNLGLSIHERLMFIAVEMRHTASHLINTTPRIPSKFDREITTQLKSRFKGISVYTPQNGYVAILGHIDHPPKPSTDELESITSGKTVVLTRSRSGSMAQIFMVKLLNPPNVEDGYLLGEISPIYLWGIGHEKKLPPMTELIVLDHKENILITSLPLPVDLPTERFSRRYGVGTRKLEFMIKNEVYLAAFWTLFMESEFLLPYWTVVLSQSKPDLLSPADQFKKTFPFIVLFSVWVVLLLSIYYIRKSLLPLKLLKEGTRRIAMGEFDERVEVNSTDEFAELSESFNEMATRLGRQVEELNQFGWGAIEALSRTVDEKSAWTAGHSERVTALALEIGSALGLDKRELEILHRGGLLHDIGKIGVPLAILDKPGELTDQEYSVVKEHPGKGARILEPINAYTDVLPIVLHHHERYDGKGYPDGLSGDAISLGGRILAVADVYDALISSRSYRKRWTMEQAIEIIKKEAGRQFDPTVVDAFLHIMKQNTDRDPKLLRKSGFSYSEKRI
jgi:putative nucleotidyltransferase with HDIG domain